MVLINGQAGTSVEVTDRGFQYGDGLFETIAVRDKKPLFLAEHLQRLILGCRTLAIPLPNLPTLTDECLSLCRQTTGRAILKIIITRGVGGRGYQQPEIIQATRVVSLHPFPSHPQNYCTSGIRTRFCQTRLGLNPALAGIKHLNRLEQIIARSEWHEPDIQEGIMLGHDGYVYEGVMSNIFYGKGQRLFTPDLSQAGIAGIIRGLVLSSRHSIGVTVTPTSQSDLLKADELFVCNSVIGIWPVVQLENQAFPIGRLTRRIQAWLEEREHENLHIVY